MPTYRFTGDSESYVPDLGLIVQPGQVVETDKKLSGAFEKVAADARSAPGTTKARASSKARAEAAAEVPAPDLADPSVKE